ncbi:response regulator transcription factor [Crocosphaera chwakensis]|uniref:Two component Transcriptional regulator, Winged helix family protein n=1 Tax=Crocosphaera chwakensis CCY0110 TaxID=391612 RepID=A3IUW8_9CHRO|nr:response regulator transcription factor [Crocosphaera chwakensis]EAZ89716.1 Two component Transcriptional regulator, Winged helix family protein [Crocosphaera chwakensis CCY0110]
MRILLVEDDERIANVLAASLTEQRYTVDMAGDGEKGWEFIEAFSYDLILLDVMLPKLNGIGLCQRIRQSGCSIPVLMLTAKDTSEDKVTGLDVGADDYVVKPFDVPELLARIRALLRRGNVAPNPILEWQQLRLDPSSYEVTYSDQILHLTPKEYGLLELFLRNENLVLSRSAILDNLWSFEDPPSEEAVKVHIKDLRKKLRKVGAPPDFIETVYGVGYRLKQG